MYYNKNFKKVGNIYFKKFVFDSTVNITKTS